MRNSFKALSITFLFVALIFITACGGTKPQGDSPASGNNESEQSEKNQNESAAPTTDNMDENQEIIVYGWAGNWDLWFKDWADMFKEETGIQIKYISGPGTEMRQRIIAENASKSDILIGTPSDNFILAQEGMLADIPWEQIPAEKYIDERFKFPQVSVWGYDMQLLAYNNQFVQEKEAPRTWKELAEPKWKDKLGLYNPSDEGASRHILVMMDKYGEEEALTLAEKQYGNSVVVFDTPGRAESSISAGESYVNTISMGGAMVALQQAGGSITTVVPEEGAFLMLNSMSMMKDAPNKEAAVEFLKFYLSEKVQSDIMNNLGISIAVNSNVQMTNEDLELGLGGKTLEEVLNSAYIPDWSYWIEEDSSGNTNLANLITEIEERIKR